MGSTQSPRTVFRRVLGLATQVLVVLALAMGILWAIPANYYLLMPGQADAVCSLVSVQGHHNCQSSRDTLFDTYVNELKADHLLYVMLGIARTDVTVEPAAAVSAGCPDAQYEEQLMQMMTDSKLEAEAAALSALGYKVRYQLWGPQVDQVSCGVPAESELRVGDRILAVDGHRITGDLPNGRPFPCPPDQRGLGCQLYSQIKYETRLHTPGSYINLTLLRNGKRVTVAVKTVHGMAPCRTCQPVIVPKGGFALIGISMSLPIKFPIKVNINTGSVGGPSAGLAFALGIIQQLTHRDLTNGNKVAVTGTISYESLAHNGRIVKGQVGPIGGARQKALAAQTAGAKYFLVPSANYAEALSAHADLTVIKVSTLRQALHVLQSLPRPTQTS